MFRCSLNYLSARKVKGSLKGSFAVLRAVEACPGPGRSRIPRVFTVKYITFQEVTGLRALQRRCNPQKFVPGNGCPSLSAYPLTLLKI